MTIDWGKIVTIAMVLVSTLILALTGHLPETVVTLVFGAATGYTFGNGIQARKGKGPEPMIGPRRNTDDETGP